MVKVKVYKIGELIKDLFVIIMIIILALCLIDMILNNLSRNKTSLQFGIIEDNILTFENDKKSLNIKMIGQEILLSNIEEEHLNIYEMEDNDLLQVELKKEKINRPSSYSVKSLSSGKIQVGDTVINNSNNIDVNISELSNVSSLVINENTKFLIYHTHTSEAYSEVGINNNFRTTDDLYNVVSVGNELEKHLKNNNFDVYHDITKHDTPLYNSSYSNSLTTVENILKTKKYNIIIDLHRDALSGNLNFRPTVQINGESAAKLMFVIGSNGSGLEHDNWMENLKLALLIQNTAEEMYPGLFRDLILSKYRYNQHLSSGAMILEVGATGNTLGETKASMKYLANVFARLRDG